jgi:hypothetical protein
LALRDEQICGNIKSLAKSENPAEAKFTLAAKNLANAAVGPKHRYHIGAGKAVLIHQISQ